MNKFFEALKLAQEQKPDEAYNLLSNIIESAPNNFDARYARAMLDISQIKKNTDNTISDLKVLISKKTKYTKAAFAFLTLVYDGLDNINEVIIYGEEAILKDAPFQEEVAFALARAYAKKETEASLTKALYYIEKCLENEESDDLFHYQICKADILTSLKKFDEANQTLANVAVNFGYSGVYYYIKARIFMGQYGKNRNIDYVDQAISNATITLQYDEKDFLSKTLLIEAYIIKKEYNKALEIIETLKPECNDEEITIEKIKVYESMEEPEKCIELIDQTLEKFPESWRLHYMKGVFQIEIEETNDQLELALESFKKAYTLFPNINIVMDIIKINKAIKKEEDNYQYLNSLLDTATNKGEIYYYLADAMNRIGKSHEEINECYRLAYEYGYIDEIEYIDLTCNFTKDPFEFSKKIKKYAKKYINKIPIWSKRKMAIRYVYGEDKLKLNFKKANQLLLECLKEETNNTCINSMYGRLQELQKDNNEAFKYYKKSYELLKDITNIDCDCAYGYYAHALFNGIGVEKNIELAKQIILEAIELSDKYTCSHIVYYYAYFFLSKDERFTSEKALELLEFNYPFYRYDISRIVFLKKVCGVLNCDSKKLEALLENNLKEYPKEEIEYYEKSILEDLPIPYWKNI